MTLNLLGLAADRLVYLGQSQSLLAQNIANIDTPGFTPRTTVPFVDTLDGVGQLPLAVTNPQDMGSSASLSLASDPTIVAARSPDGNAVSLDGQLAAVARTQINQQYAVNIYKSYLGMFTTALGPNP